MTTTNGNGITELMRKVRDVSKDTIRLAQAAIRHEAARLDLEGQRPVHAVHPMFGPMLVSPRERRAGYRFGGHGPGTEELTALADLLDKLPGFTADTAAVERYNAARDLRQEAQQLADQGAPRAALYKVLRALFPTHMPAHEGTQNAVDRERAESKRLRDSATASSVGEAFSLMLADSWWGTRPYTAIHALHSARKVSPGKVSDTLRACKAHCMRYFSSEASRPVEITLRVTVVGTSKTHAKKAIRKLGLRALESWDQQGRVRVVDAQYGDEK